MSLLTEASLIVTPNAYNVGKLYSVIPNTTLGDMDVVRATSATRVNEQGLIEIARTNLLLQSQTFDNASWNKNASGINTSIGTSGIESNVANAPSGTLTADRVNFNPQIDLDLGLKQVYAAAVATQSFVSSIYVKGEGSNIGKQIRLRIKRSLGGSYAAVDTTITLTSDWVRITSSALTLLALNTGVQYIISSNDATNALIWGAQLEAGETATEYIPTTTSIRTKFAGITQDGGFGSDIPRIDYPPLGGCPSILVEPARTNLVLYSEQFDNVYWVKNLGGVASAPVVTPNVETAPDGTTTADRVVFNLNGGTASGDFSQLDSALFASISITRTQSVYIKTTDGTTKIFSFVSPTGTLATITVTSVYQRFTFTSTGINSSSIRLRLRGGEGTSTSATIAIWGAQYEAGSYATSYIPTFASTITRTADIITKTGTTTLIGQSEGTIFWNVKDLTESTSSGNPDFGIRNSAFSNWIGISTNTSAEPFRVLIKPTTGASIDYRANITTAKACVKYGTFGVKLFVNGVPVATLAVNPNFSFDQIEIKAASMSYKVNSFMLWKTALTDDQCILLTGPSFSSYPEMASALIYTLQ